MYESDGRHWNCPKCEPDEEEEEKRPEVYRVLLHPEDVEVGVVVAAGHDEAIDKFFDQNPEWLRERNRYGASFRTSLAFKPGQPPYDWRRVETLDRAKADAVSLR